jgi:hypothetical protein
VGAYPEFYRQKRVLRDALEADEMLNDMAIFLSWVGVSAVFTRLEQS